MQLHAIRATRLILAGAAMATLYACADAAPRLAGPVSGPLGAKSTSEDATLVTTSTTETLVGLTRDVALPTTLYTEGIIGKGGGSLKIDAAGVTLKVPAGQVSEPTRFAIRALSGNLLAYEFEPEGIVFPRNVLILQDLKYTSWYKRPVDTELPAGYFASVTQIDFLSGTLTTNEVVDTKLSVKNARLEIPVRHFSGYMVASGRSR